ncbi:hypothetical protein BH11CYA1_BH11CYA1_01120 [soil metagenome]
MSVKPADQPSLAPENKLDANKTTVDQTLSNVDRVDLLRQYQPADPGKLSIDMPNLTLQGWQDFSLKTTELTNKTDKVAPGSDQQKPTELTKEEKIGNAKKALESPEASIKQKMDAMSTIFNESEKGKDGRVQVTLNDGGKERSFDIQSLAAGKDVKLLQLSTKDDNGKSHPVLRGVERNGEIEQQHKRDGSKADYRGDWWTVNAKDSSISKFGTADRNTVPVDPSKAETDKGKTAPEYKALPEEVPIPRRRPHFQSDPDKVSPEKGQEPSEKQPEKKNKGDVIIPWKNQESDSNTGAVRSMSEQRKFYTHQDDGKSCAAFAVGMALADHKLGRPVQYGDESQRLKRLTGTTDHGYRGTLNNLADQVSSLNLQAKPYDYGLGKVGPQAMNDLDRELAKGHSAVAKVINPHTGNPHYIYVAGRDANGQYILGDPDRKNTQHFKPVSRAHLQNMMSRRDGFVAVW